MGRLKPIPQLKNGGNGLPKTGIGGKNNRAASIPNKPGDKAIGNGSKPQDIAKDMRDKVGEAVKNLNSPNDQPQEPENIEEPMPDPGSLIDEVPQQSLAGSLNNPGSLNAGNGGLGGDGNNGKDKNGKKKKTPMDKLKGKVKRAVIQAILSHLMPIFIGVMAFGAIGSCSAAMFTGGDNTEIEQTRGQNRKIIINGGSNSNTSSSDSSSGGGTPFDGDWVYYNQSNPNWDLTGSKQSKESWINASCGICSYAMVISSYSKDTKYTPTWCELNGLTSGVGIWQGPMCDYVNNHQDIFHLKAEHVEGTGPNDWQQNWDKVKTICNNGGCVIIGQTAQSCLGGNHYIVVRKVDGDDVTIADPVGGVERKISAKKLLSSPIGNQPTKNIYFEKVN